MLFHNYFMMTNSCMFPMSGCRFDPQLSSLMQLGVDLNLWMTGYMHGVLQTAMVNAMVFFEVILVFFANF